MQTRNIKIALVGVCVLALGAGVFAGMAVSHLPAKTSDPALVGTDHSPLTDELNLTPQQRDQMRSIWEGVRLTTHSALDSAQLIQAERDKDIVGLLTDEQKLKYAAIVKRTNDEFAALSAKRDAAFREGVEKTRKILTEEQRARYDDLIRERVGSLPASTSPGQPTIAN